jgi:hypothetical protein
MCFYNRPSTLCILELRLPATASCARRRLPSACMARLCSASAASSGSIAAWAPPSRGGRRSGRWLPRHGTAGVDGGAGSRLTSFTCTNVTQRALSITQLALSVTQLALIVTQRALSVTQRALSVTQRALSVTQLALSVTQRALSVTQEAGGGTVPFLATLAAAARAHVSQQPCACGACGATAPRAPRPPLRAVSLSDPAPPPG